MNKKDYVLEVVLEQLTPYVNEIDIKKKKPFSPKEKGKDILRTTEFKPRFDKYLISKYKEELSDLLQKTKEEDKDRKALDYSITIGKFDSKTDYETRVQENTFLTSGMPYYAREENVKLKIRFFSFKPRMIELIKENLAEFLAVTNFGKRKNKCYGSFYISPEDENYKDIDDIGILKEFCFFKENKEKLNYLEYKNQNIKTLYKKVLEKNIVIDGKTRKRPLIVLRWGNEKYRNESLGIMKILKKDENYRLYFIPNFELLRALLKKHEIWELEDKRCICKCEPNFNREEFFSYIKRLK